MSSHWCSEEWEKKLALIEDDLRSEGWDNNYPPLRAWRKNGEVIYLTDSVIEFMDFIANKNHRIGFEKGAYEQQQQEDVDASCAMRPTTDDDGFVEDGLVPVEPLKEIAYLDGPMGGATVRRIQVAEDTPRTAAEKILNMIDEMIRLHACAVSNKSFSAAVSISQVVSSLHNDLKEALREDRLTSGGTM